MSENRSHAVIVRGLEVRVPSAAKPFAGPLPVVRGLDLTVPTGQVTVMVGANGAGKTTTLRAVTGAHPFSAGSIEVLGTALGPARVRPPQGVASLPGISAHPRRWTSRHIARMRKDAVPGFDVTWFEELLTAFGIPREQEVNRLSQGQATQLGLASALAQDPRLLILDEPFAHLDPLARTELVDVLRCFMAGEDRTLLIATHDLEGMERFADQLVMVSRGVDVVSGDVESLRDEFLLCAIDSEVTTELEASLVGPTTTGAGTSALVAVDDAVGLPTTATLRRPDVSEIVTHLLRAARDDAAAERRTAR
ncbi:ATP-binding cassette domain-containing protein [Brachybacterium saurashtrense]|uniref:ABC transporter ATP-binding protein n=1 Tax=Brachybacterium saurashtrense TaxID=556288 RepID=A0A345YKD0_9MICO|nr:ABC transporter ATP-binding protein [Brachybacterium saurashtrense]AXK44382.1 ABC transporter ATP-binding protein [Brachybacterium saurashtrense]RRR22993.1 ABC transporter ATP-binding protein [Brachybacterium saurashtrense]